MADGWFIQRDGQKLGPYSSAQLKQMTTTGQLLPVDLVARGDGGKWVPASQIKGLFVPPAAEPLVAHAAPAEVSSESFDFGQPGPASKSSLPKKARPVSLPIRDRLKSLAGGLSSKAKIAIGHIIHASTTTSDQGGLSSKAKIAIGGGLLLVFLWGVSCVMFGGKSGTTTAGKNGLSGGSRGSLSSAARENSEYKRGYKIGSVLGERIVNAEAKNLEDHRPAFRASAMKSLNKPKWDFEKEYQDLSRSYGPDHDATLLYRGMLDGYTDVIAKAGIDLD